MEQESQHLQVNGTPASVPLQTHEASPMHPGASHRAGVVVV
jgi:hypothetical protein